MAKTTITVIPSQKRKEADLCKSQTADGKRITVWRNHNVCWVCHEGDLQVDFGPEKPSPFKSGRKHLTKVKKGKATAQEETRDLKAKEKFGYAASVVLPDGTTWHDCDLEVDPSPGPR